MNRSMRELLPIAMRERRGNANRARVPERMAMNDPDSVEQFHAGGAALPTMQAVYDLSARSLDALVPHGGRLLDLGVGSGRGLGRFLAMRRDVTATGVDLAPNMLAEARRLLNAEGVGERVVLLEADLTALPGSIAAQSWDAICSVWTLHHMPTPEALQAALRRIAKLRERGDSAVWVLDFQRLRDGSTLAELLGAGEGELPSALYADAVASEAAAFTQEELREELTTAGLGDLESGVAQPIAWLQAFWCHAQHKPPPRERARPAPLDHLADAEATRLRRAFTRLPS